MSSVLYDDDHVHGFQFNMLNSLSGGVVL